MAGTLRPSDKLYEYIGHYWKFGFDDLWAADFDLEECFTLLEQHEKEAERPMNTTEAGQR
jgi:hypothetical protein